MQNRIGPVRILAVPAMARLASLIVAAAGLLSGQAPESALARLKQALDKGRVEEARTLLPAVLQQPNLDAGSLLGVGLQLADQELYPEAERVFARAAREYPGRFDAHYNLALATFALHQFDQALTCLERAPAGSRPDELARRYLRGKIYDSLRRQDLAEADLAAAFSGQPSQENYGLDLGLFYLRQRAYERAASTFQAGLVFHPRSSFFWLGLSLAQLLGGKGPQAADSCRKLLATEPGFAPARLLWAYSLYSAGEYEKCEQAASAGLRAAQPHPYLYYLHAAVLLKMESKDYGLIEGELTLAAGAIPNCSLCLVARSKVRQEQGAWEAAIADLETVVSRMDQDSSQAWYRLAALYARAGRREDAARARERVRAIKAESNQDNELVRQIFLRDLGGAGETQR
jgi:predicted Zn-dependent protease